MQFLLKNLFPKRYEASGMLENYLKAQYGPYLLENPNHASEDFYQQLLAIARPYIRSDTRALDVGCATGRLVFEYANLGAREATGIDSSANFIECCNAIKNGELKEIQYSVAGHKTAFLKDDICDTKLPHSSFEFVSAINIIDRVHDPKKVVEALEKVTVAGGILLLTDPYDWELSPTPKKSQVSDMKNLLDERTWKCIEEKWIHLKMPITGRAYRDYNCHVVVAQKLVS